MSISEIHPYYSKFGAIRYFRSSRWFADDDYREFIKGKISAKELVTFDCGLMLLQEIEEPDIHLLNGDEQIMAVIMRPEIEPNRMLEHDRRFEFCGYDLVENQTSISAITDCGASFASIRYENLNQYGLISSYREAVNTQLDLYEEDPEESHAYCEIVEIWRSLP